MDGERGTGGRGMEPIRFERVFHVGIVSDSWSEGILPKATTDERTELERSILRDGCIDPVITWRGKIVDGHMRADICEEHDLDYPTREIDFESREHAEAWVIRKQVGRRNLDDVGRCEMAEKIEGLLQVAARERQRKGGREHGRGMKGEVPPAPDVPYKEEAPKPLGPFGGLLDDVIDEKGESMVKAAKVVQVGKETYRRYKRMKRHYAPPAGNLLPAEKEERQKEWGEILGRMRGPSPKTTIGEEHKTFDVARKAEDRKAEHASRIARAREELGGKEEHVYRAWGPDGPTWCKGKFQKPENLKLLPDGSVKLLLTDPPYGMNYNPNDPTRAAIEGDVDEGKAARLLRQMLRLMRPKLAPDAHVVFFCGVKQESRMRKVLDAEKWLKRQSHVIWVKNTHGQGVPEGFAPKHERALHATHGNPGFVKRPVDAFWADKKLSKDHLTEKPTELLRQLIEALTTPEEMVADPFGGTASTLVAAVELGRRAWGCELDKDHHATGWSHIDDAVKKRRSGKKVARTGAKKIRRKPTAPRSRPQGAMGFVMATAAPEPELSLEESVAPVAGAVTWGWTE